MEHITSLLSERKSVMQAVDDNLVDKVWKDKTPSPKHPVIVHDSKYSGETTERRLERMRDLLLSKKCNAVVIAALDQICWILNMRGSDIDYNPLFMAYLTLDITDKETVVSLYSDPEKFKEPAVQEYLKKLNIHLLPYGQVFADLQKWTGRNIGVEQDSVNAKIMQTVKSKTNIIIDLQESIPYLKVIKNKVELYGFRQCHIRDGAGLVKYLAWLDHQLNVEKRTDINEYMGTEKVLEFRKTQPLFMGLSFDTISSIGRNGSVIHYSPEKEGSLAINNKEVYLLDSGSQFLYVS